MLLGKRQRKVILIVGTALGGLSLLCVSLPLWFPWVATPLARKQGIHFARYERLSYNRFALHDLTFTNKDVRLRAREVEAFVPTVWLWKLSSTNAPSPFVRVNGWEVETLVATNKTGASSTYTNAQEIGAILQTVQRWLPAATLSNGTINVQKTVLRIPATTWARGKVEAQLGISGLQQADVSAILPQRGGYKLQIHSEAVKLDSAIHISMDSNSVTLQGTNLWQTNQVELHARFGREGTLPESASLQARDFRFAGELIGLKEYGDIRGSMSAHWERGALALDLDSEATPVISQTNLPPVKVTVHARGDTNSVMIKTATLSSPWGEAELSEGVNVYFTGPLVRESATLKVSANLARQPWIPLQGTLTGQADFLPAEMKFPLIHFHLSGMDVGQTNVTAKTLTLEGNLDWPSLVVTNASAIFQDGSTLEAHGQTDLSQKSIGDAAIEFKGPLLQQWLPPGYSCQTVSFSGNVHGPWKQLIHAGHVEVTNFTNPQFQPLEVHLDWKGEQLSLGSFNLLVAAGMSSLVTRGSVAHSESATNLIINALTLRKNSKPVLELRDSTRISANLDGANTKWRTDIDSFHWVGEAGDIEAKATLEWPRQGRLEVSIQKVHSDLFQDFLRETAETFEISNLKCAAGWTNGAATVELQLSADGFAQAGVPLAAEVSLHGDGKGVVISNLVVTSQTNLVAEARGSLPVAWTPADPTNAIFFNTETPLQFTVTTKPEAVFWNKLADWTGINLSEPNCKIDLAGTWASPRGEVRIGARQVQLRKVPREMPKLENLKIVIELDRERARITQAELEVQNQPVTLTGEMPLGQSFWTGLKQKKIPNWEQATARLHVGEAQVAAFSLLLPKVLSPQGVLNLDVSLLPGGNLTGELELEKGRTRPLGNLGPIRDISTRMKFAGRTMQLESATANIGGAVVYVSGQADFRGSNWLKGEVPPFQIKLIGTNVPLSRQPDAIIRSDLDLAIIKTNEAAALISGTAKLRDSFFLRDLHDLIPGGVAAPARRPPYFSIETEPLAEWRLAVRVTGTRFVRIRSTLFDGEASANLRLEGTLKEPVALGDVKIDSGIIRFPFASLQVRQGFVTLSSEDPYHPQLTLSAGSKKFGYEVKMEASGPVDAPILQFSSIPPLSSEQLVLMLTAGEVPKGTLTLTPQQKAQTVAVFFGRDLLTRLGLGDESEDRLTIQSGQEVTDQGKPTYGLEYKLNKRWSLVGEYDRFNAFNAGLKWRVYSK